MGVILTGASNDGCEGLAKVKEVGGRPVVQDPQTAESRAMPEAAIRSVPVEHILPLDKIAGFLIACASAVRGHNG